MANDVDSVDGATPSPTCARLAALHRYMTALDRGDATIVAAILRLAETDAALERMILAANSAYLDLDQPESAHSTERLPATLDRPAMPTATSGPKAPSLPPIGCPRPIAHPRPAVQRWVGAFAAVLVVSLLLGGFFALFAAHGALGPAADHHRAMPTVPSASLTPHTSYSGPTIIAGAQDGSVLALRIDTGALVWRWGGHSHETLDVLLRSSGVVYVTWHPNPVPKNDQATRLTALRASDGTQLWQTTEPQLVGYTYMALDGQTLLVASNYGDGTVYALDASSGKTRWTSSNTAGREDMLIAAGGGVVFIDGVDQGFIALDERTGQTRWTYRGGQGPALASGINGPTIVPASGGGLVYYYLFDLVSLYPPNTPSVVTLDASTGVVRATLTWGETGSPILVTPDGVAYAAKNNQFCAYRIADATLLWCAPSIDDFSLRLARASGTLCYSRITAGANGGSPVEVGALDNTTGSPLWTWQGPASLYSATNSMSLVCSQGALYLATRHGLYAFQRATGHLLWHAVATTDLSFMQPALAP